MINYKQVLANANVLLEEQEKDGHVPLAGPRFEAFVVALALAVDKEVAPLRKAYLRRFPNECPQALCGNRAIDGFHAAMIEGKSALQCEKCGEIFVPDVSL